MGAIINVSPRGKLAHVSGQNYSNISTFMDGAQNIDLGYQTGQTSQRIAIPSGAVFLRLYPTTHCYYKLGGDDVVAALGDEVLQSGAVEYVAVGNHTHFAVIAPEDPLTMPE